MEIYQIPTLSVISRKHGCLDQWYMANSICSCELREQVQSLSAKTCVLVSLSQFQNCSGPCCVATRRGRPCLTSADTAGGIYISKRTQYLQAFFLVSVCYTLHYLTHLRLWRTHMHPCTPHKHPPHIPHTPHIHKSSSQFGYANSHGHGGIWESCSLCSHCPFQLGYSHRSFALGLNL